MDYPTLIRKLGSLHSALDELARKGDFQGEHTIVYTGADGTQRTVHVYIDGTELQMTDSPPTSALRFSTDVPGSE